MIGNALSPSIFGCYRRKSGGAENRPDLRCEIFHYWYQDERSATLNGAALRNLFDHAVARLDEKWRHLPASAWQAPVRTAQGRLVPAAETAWMRAREVWIHAVDLDTGARFGDFPDVLLDSLLDDIVGTWRRNGQGAGLVLSVDGRAGIAVQDNTPVDATIRGPLPAVVRWAAGRGGIAHTTGTEKNPPPWL